VVHSETLLTVSGRDTIGSVALNLRDAARRFRLPLLRELNELMTVHRQLRVVLSRSCFVQMVCTYICVHMVNNATVEAADEISCVYAHVVYTSNPPIHVIIMMIST